MCEAMHDEALSFGGQLRSPYHSDVGQLSKSNDNAGEVRFCEMPTGAKTNKGKENMQNYIGNIGSSYLSNSSDLAEIDNIKRNSKSQKEQLEKVSREFESIFVAKMLNELDKTVDKEGSLFQESKYLDNLKSFMYNDIARTIANNPKTSLGIAKQMYTQLEKTVKD